MFGSSLYVRSIEMLWDKVDNRQEYPFNIPIIQDLKEIQLNTSVTMIIGENGSGKSTLLEALAVNLGFNPEGGTKNFNFSSRDSHSKLSEYIRVTRGDQRNKNGFFFRAESYYNVATNIDQLDEEPAFGPPIKCSFGGRSLHELSHGESFLAAFKNRFGGLGLYILDEPEAALSPLSQMSMIPLIRNLVRKNSQFIIATHSPIIMAYPGAELLQLSQGRLKRASYEDTDHYIITKEFMNNREKMLKILLSEE
ncbi:MAG: AAA family ATPase [Sporomusaceae bacterium]|nr:AAA family ATPase [Sporomusaceae bacterium]